MITPELLTYIKQQLAQNASKEQIKGTLIGNGWDAGDVEEGFLELTPTPIVPPPPVFASPQTIQPEPVLTSVKPVATPDISHASFVPPAMSRNLQGEIQQPRASVQEPHSKKRQIAYIVLIVILLGGLGGGVYAYYTGAFVSLPNLVSQSIDSARKSTSASYDATITIDSSGAPSLASGLNELLGGANATTATITAKGSYDSSDSNNKKGSSSISIDAGAISMGAEFRVLNDIFYGEITKAPTIAFIPTLSSLENKWFSIPLKSNDGTAVDNPFSSITGAGSDITSKLTPDQQEHIYEMTRNGHFVKTLKRLAPETVGGVLSYHFTFVLDREGITNYLTALKEYIHTIGNNDSALSAFDPTEINTSLDQVKNFTGEIWIGRSDTLLHKISLNFSVQPDGTKAEEVKISLISIFSNWNQPVSIIAPTDSVPFGTLISSLMAPPAPTKTATPKLSPKK